MGIIWNIPNGEQVLERLEELYQYLENFPESQLAPAILQQRYLIATFALSHWIKEVRQCVYIILQETNTALFTPVSV